MNEAKIPPTTNESRDPTLPADPRPAYEPPRIVKKRSVARATLFSGSGPSSAPALVPNG